MQVVRFQIETLPVSDQAAATGVGPRHVYLTLQLGQLGCVQISVTVCKIIGKTSRIRSTLKPIEYHEAPVHNLIKPNLMKRERHGFMKSFETIIMKPCLTICFKKPRALAS